MVVAKQRLRSLTVAVPFSECAALAALPFDAVADDEVSDDRILLT
jgi:hypothetical protein